jgi:hypothetical protein
LVPGPPRKKAISMQPQAQSMKATAPSRAAIKAASQSRKYRLDPAATNNGTIHQPLLSRSCRRLIEVARKIQDEHGHAGEIGGQRDNVEQRKGCATSSTKISSIPKLIFMTSPLRSAYLNGARDRIELWSPARVRIRTLRDIIKPMKDIQPHRMRNDSQNLARLMRPLKPKR